MANLVWAAARGRRRSFAQDARRAIQGVCPGIRVLGAEHIPAKGPALITCNHYSRPGFGAWWIALGISAIVAQHRAIACPADLHWVMTAAWRYPEGDWRSQIVTPATVWAFARAARVYGHMTMPPMPPDPRDVEARAAAVLRTVRLARDLAPHGGLLALAPQGDDAEDLLARPPAGAGEFIGLLVNEGLPVLPVGVTERKGRLQLSFGPLFTPQIPRRNAGRDRIVIDQVMTAIAACLQSG